MPLSRSLTRDRQPWKPPVAPPPPRLADLAQSGSDEFVVVDDFYATPGAPADPTARPLDDEGLRAAETLAHGAMVLVKVADDLSRDVDEELDATRVAERPGPRALAIYVDCLKHLTKASHLVGDSGRPREGDRERSGRRSPGSLRDLDVLDRDATAAKLRDYIDDAYAVILDRAKHCEAHVETLEGLADETPFLSGADAAAERAVRVARRGADLETVGDGNGALDCYEAALDCCRALLDVAPLSDGARARLLDLAAADGALAVAVARLSTPRETPATK